MAPADHSSHTNAKHRLCQHYPSSAAQCRSRADLALSAHAVAAGRLQLPASADLLGLWRRGDRTFRIVGRRMDDAGADIALPALGHIRHRQRADNQAAGCTMVSAVALRTLARRQRRLKNRHRCSSALLLHGNPSSATRIDLMLPQGGHKAMRWKISHHGHDPRQIDLLAIARATRYHRHHRRSLAPFQRQLRTSKHDGLHRAEPKRAMVKCEPRS